MLLYLIVNGRLEYYWAFFKLIAELIHRIMACFVFVDRLGRNCIYLSVSFLWGESNKGMEKPCVGGCFGPEFPLG